MTITAIPTRYKGYHFRSRLEARWAVFFDALCLKWEYEPQGFDLGVHGYYLPDFKVQYPGRSNNERHWQWFEVKGAMDQITTTEWKKLAVFDVEHNVIILDEVPAPVMYLEATAWLTPQGVPLRKEHDSDEIQHLLKRDELTAYVHDPQDRAGNALWCPKGRIWWDDRETFFSPTTYFGSGEEIEDACAAARSARFEHGEVGAT